MCLLWDYYGVSGPDDEPRARQRSAITDKLHANIQTRHESHSAD